MDYFISGIIVIALNALIGLIAVRAVFVFLFRKIK